MGNHDGNIEADEMIHCRFFDREDVDSKEHIMPNAMGGKRTMPGVLGKKGNNDLGKEIDAPFEECWRPISISLGARRGDGKPVAAIRNLTTSSGTAVSLDAKGMPSIRHKDPVTITENADGSQSLQITANTHEQAVEIMAHQLRRFKMKPEKLKEFCAKAVSRPVGTIPFTLPIGGPAQERCVAKMGIMALAGQMGRGFVDAPALDDAIGFVAHGGDTACQRVVDPASRAQIDAVFGLNLGEHLLALHDSPDGLSAIFTAFGVVPYWVRLTDVPVGLPQAILHRVDPLQHTHVVETPGSPELQWPPERDATDRMESFRQSISTFASLIQARQAEQWCASVVETAIAPLVSLPKGTTIEQHHMDQVVSNLMLSIKQRITGDEIKRSLDANSLLADAIKRRTLIDEADSG